MRTAETYEPGARVHDMEGDGATVIGPDPAKPGHTLIRWDCTGREASIPDYRLFEGESDA